MTTCPSCRAESPAYSRFCITCGRSLDSVSDTSEAPVRSAPDRGRQEMNLRILYGMAAALVVAALFPPWESPPGQPPEFLGFHFIMTGPGLGREGVISRFLWTIELVTIAMAGFYFSWLFGHK